MKFKKIFFVLLTISICLFGLSVSSFAYSSQLPSKSVFSKYLTETDDSWELHISSYLSEDSDYKRWKSIYDGDLPGIALISFSHATFGSVAKDYVSLQFSSKETYSQVSYLDYLGCKLYNPTVIYTGLQDGVNGLFRLSKSSSFSGWQGGVDYYNRTALSSNIPIPSYFSGSVVDFGDKPFVIVDAPISHTVTIDYKYENGEQAAESYIDTLDKDSSFSVSSPVIAGYEPSIALVEGVMGSADLQYTVTYTKKRYNLTINYKYENGEQAAESYVESFAMGDSYSVLPPQIEGYIPDSLSISGTMGGADVALDVIYSKAKSTVTIYYKFLNGSMALLDYRQPFDEGAYFEVPTPILEGYKPSLDIISGTMGNSNLVYTVTFTPDAPPESSSSDSSSSSSSSSSDTSSNPFLPPVIEDSGSDPFAPPLIEDSGSDPFAPPSIEDSGSDPFAPPSIEDSGSDPFAPPSIEDSGNNPFLPPVTDGNGKDPFAPPALEDIGKSPFLPPTITYSENPFIAIFESWWSKMSPKK